MSALYFFDQWPSWMIFFVLVVAFSLFSEIGYQIGRFRHRALESLDSIQPKGIVGAVIALLAFMLAFTFGQAGSHFTARKQLILQEANAIGTAYLRADVLPEEQQQHSKELLREYVDVRLNISDKEPETVKNAVKRSVEIHNQLWSNTMAENEENSCTFKTGLLMEALNEVFDLHAKRISAVFHNRIPAGIRFTLVFLALVSFLLRGYMDGLSGTVRNLFATTILVLAFSSVLVLIIDLDRPPYADQRLLEIGQQSLIDLQQGMRP